MSRDKQIEIARELCPFSQEYKSCSECDTELDIGGEPCSYMIYQENTDAFNFICGTDFTVEQMEYIYTYLGNGIKHKLAKQFVKNGFDLSVIANYTRTPQNDEVRE